MTILRARPSDDLCWNIPTGETHFEFDLGLNQPFFPLEDELYFHSLGLALRHFTDTIWPLHPDAAAVLFRGDADFSSFFHWSPTQEENFREWVSHMPLNDIAHQKRLFCAESFVNYFQMLAHKLPDEMEIKLILDPSHCGSLAETLQLISPVRFEHFVLETGREFQSNLGVCFPADELCSAQVLAHLNQFIPTLPHFRPIYEPILTAQWDGLDEIYILPEIITPQLERKLKGFKAAGGKILEIKT